MVSLVNLVGCWDAQINQSIKVTILERNDAHGLLAHARIQLLLLHQGVRGAFAAARVLALQLAEL